MKVIVQGQQMDVGDALRQHIEDHIKEISEKFFDHAIQGNVHLTPAPHNFIHVDITLSVGNGILMRASAEESQPYPAFDAAADKIKKQLRRYKAKLRDHSRKASASEVALGIPANQYVIESGQEKEEEAPENPVIIAETQTVIEDLTVSEAVMRMDLGDLPALMFRDRKTQALNMVYRRKDGNIGWVDSESAQKDGARQAAE